MNLGKYTDGIYALDFEFRPAEGRAGNPPDPVCLVIKRLDTGAVSKYWQDDLIELKEAPFPTGPTALWIAYFSSAEWGCFLALGWKLPEEVLDLYVEFRWLTNGRNLTYGNSLLGALAYFSLPSGIESQKEQMRELVLRGGTWSATEKRNILEYCASDVEALNCIYNAMRAYLDMPRAVLRGRYMVAVARMEFVGIPIDTATLELFRRHWDFLKRRLVNAVDKAYGVFEDGVFRRDKFSAWLRSRSMQWPLLPDGQLDLDDQAFRTMSLIHPIVEPLRQLRGTLAKTRDIQLEVGDDGRSRCLLSPFRAKTGRNQPSTSRFAYALPAWMRHLIKPQSGMALAYIDWEQQEFGIGAALSGDAAMQEAYASGDPYLEFAKQAGAVPQSATRATHSRERDQFKACVLATQYGLGAESLAQRIDVPVAEARHLLFLHRTTYPTFWRWSDDAVDEAAMSGRLWTCYGWQIDTRTQLNDRSLRNFPMQAHGAEMLRLGCILMTEAGLRVCAPVHDAVLLEAPIAGVGESVQLAREKMAEASRHVLGGFELRTDAGVVRHPDQLGPGKGKAMLDTVIKLLEEIEAAPEVLQ